MRTPSFVLALALVAPMAAQPAPFDAAVVVFDELSSAKVMLDLDGDGGDDFVGYWSSRITGHVHDGAQGFVEAFSFTESLATQLSGWEMLPGRFDGDARDDFVLYDGADIRVWLSRGRADPVLAWTTPASFGGALTVLDYDGDSLDDLVVGTASTLTVYRNTGGAFEVTGTGSGQATELYAFDHDGDGRRDVVSRIGTRFELWTIDVHGVPVRGATILHNVYRTFEESMPVFGDIDGDGDEDVVVFGMWGQYRVLRRSGPASFELEPFQAGGPATHFADIDNDGDLDGVCCGGGGGTGPSVNEFVSTYHVTRNDGTGAFDDATAITGLGASQLAGASDVDGDGRLDLVAGRTVLFNREGFSREVQPALALPGVTEFLSYDTDRDGDSDLQPASTQLAFRPEIWANDGAGGFAKKVEVQTPPPTGSAWIMPGYRGDFDGDGDDDLIVTEYGNGWYRKMQLLANQGGGSYVDAGPATEIGRVFPPSFPRVTIGPRAITFDADDDGDLDIVPAFSPTWVWLNDGSGYFERGQSLPVDDVVGHADFDGDGAADLVLFAQGGLEIWFGDGQGAFVKALTQPIGVSPAYATIAIGDVDADGDPDVVWPRAVTAQMLRNLGGRGFQLETLATPRLRNNALYGFHARILDVNEDGVNDLMLFPVEYAGRTTAILLGDGRGGLLSPIVQYLEPEGMVDVDSDGDIDAVSEGLLVRNATYGLEAGHRVQYGQSGTGLGGVAPTFGSTGPVRAETPMTIRIGGMPGGTTLVYVVGTSPANLPEFPVPGAHTWVYPWLGAVVLTASGAPGEAGTGVVEYSYTMPASAAGLSLFKQAYVLDPSLPSLVNYTNGLEIRYGMSLSGR